jgi:hypothetical protein
LRSILARSRVTVELESFPPQVIRNLLGKQTEGPRFAYLRHVTKELRRAVKLDGAI